MHHNLPTIKPLHLEGRFSGDMPRDILPARLITKLSTYINLTDNQSTYLQFYKYICKKYPYVEKLTYDDRVIMYKPMDYNRVIYNEGILPLYQSIGSRADAFTFSNYCDGLDMFKKFDASGINLRELTVSSLTPHVTFSLR